MHTETLFSNDQAFYAFTTEHLHEARPLPTRPTPHRKIWSIFEPDTGLDLYYAVTQEEKQTHLHDALPIALPTRDRNLPFEVSNGPEEKGLRTYLTLHHPMLPQPLTAINTHGWQIDPTQHISEGKTIIAEVGLCGLVPFVEPYLKGTYHINEDTPAIQYELLRGHKPINEFEFRFARILNSFNDEEAPEVYEFVARIERITPFQWFGTTCYRIYVRTVGLDNFSFPYELIISEVVLRGYIPRLGDTITGTAYLYATCEKEKTDSQTIREFKALQEKTDREEAQEPDYLEEEPPPAQTRTFPWGIVAYDEHENPIGMTPNDDYPSITHQQDSPLFKLKVVENNAPPSHFRSASHPYFRFYDEFATLLPRDLEVCERSRESIIGYIDLVKVFKEQIFSSKNDTIGILQTAYSPSTGKTLIRFNVPIYKETLPADLILLVDESKHRLLIYTISYDTDQHFPLTLNIKTNINNKANSRISTEELWQTLPEFSPGDFAIIVKDIWGGFVQFKKLKNGLFIFEFQQAGTDWQFTTDNIPEEQIRPACENFFADNHRIYTQFPWESIRIKRSKSRSALKKASTRAKTHHEQSQIPFIQAIIDNNISLVERMLTENPSLLTAHDWDKNEYYSEDLPIHYAADDKHLPVLRLLLDRGAPIDGTTLIENETALSYALYCSELKTAKELIRRGATVIHTLLGWSRSHLYLAAICKKDELFEIILSHYAAYRGDEWMEFLAEGAKGAVNHHNLKRFKRIHAAGWNINTPCWLWEYEYTSKNSHDAPVPFAVVMSDWIEGLKYLISQGLDLQIKNEDGFPLINYAAPDTADFLFDQGFTPVINPIALGYCRSKRVYQYIEDRLPPAAYNFFIKHYDVLNNQCASGWGENEKWHTSFIDSHGRMLEDWPFVKKKIDILLRIYAPNYIEDDNE